MKRFLRFTGTDGSDGDVVVSKVTAIKSDKLKAAVFHVDKLDDGTFRITYNENTFPDIKDLKSIEIIRED